MEVCMELIIKIKNKIKNVIKEKLQGCPVDETNLNKTKEYVLKEIGHLQIGSFF